MIFSKNRNIPTCNIYLDNEKIKQVQEFEYLGSMITSDVRRDKDIRSRIAIAKKNLGKRKAFLQTPKYLLKKENDF